MDGILRETPDDHPDADAIPQLLAALDSLTKDAEPHIVSAEQKVEQWRYNLTLLLELMASEKKYLQTLENFDTVCLYIFAIGSAY